MAENRKVVIVGSGPAGYTAGVYLSRAALEPVLFSGQEIGGQLIYTTLVENYPGFAEGVQGPDLMIAMRAQAEHFGTKIHDSLVTSIKAVDGGWEVTDGENTYVARAVLIATGAKSRMLGLPKEDTLLGHGVSTCAVCDAAFFRDKVTFVLGGGDSAMEDSLALSKFAKEVYVVHRRGEFKASQIMQDRVLNNPKIKVLWNTEVMELLEQDGKVSGLKLKNNQTNQEETRPADGVFYAIGHIPSTEVVKDLVQRNAEGYIITNFGLGTESVGLAQQAVGETGRVPYVTATSQHGIFAAGDCVDFRYQQAVTAAGFGCMAALDVERWLEAQG